VNYSLERIIEMDQPLPSPSDHEFRVNLRGISLPPETIDRISQALQKAVLLELANIDLRRSLGNEFRVLLSENGGTQGITINPRREA
jgi:hypothetical protein